MPQNPAKPHDPHSPMMSSIPLPLRGFTAVAVADADLRNPAAPPSSGWRGWLLRSERMRSLLSFQVSLVVHCLALIILGMVIRSGHEGQRHVWVVVAPERADEEPLTIIETTPESSALLEQAAPTVMAESAELAESTSQIELTSPISNPASGGVTSRPADAAREVPISDLLLATTVPTGGGLEGRAPDERARLVAQRGGSPGSEKAVEMGLEWLAAHQRQDGSWHLNHRLSEECNCPHPGITETTTGATSLALLPFLGAGYTHRAGPYREVVRDGVNYLLTRIKHTQLGADLREGTGHEMYSHGLATIVLCETYAMTGDEELRQPAQSAIDFICAAQHPRGGWRYKPGQPGDTTVTGWQVMALKSARMAQLEVPSPVVEKAKMFLNSVQDGRGGGAFYGYLGPGKDPGPTSVGLLLRMYLGWRLNDDRLRRGVTYLSSAGPSDHDMYYNYYATQIMHHYGGNYWPAWNERMRDYLIATQAKEGHAAGSWFFPDPHGSLAGRHYTTAMCIMILEVYYRHMPLYGEGAVKFEL